MDMLNLIDFQLRPLLEEEAAWRSVIYAPIPPPDIEVRVRWVKRTLKASAEALFVDLFAQSACAFWLDSSRVIPGLSRFSFMGDAAGADVTLYRGGSVAIERDGERTSEPAEQGFFRYLRDRLRRYRASGARLPFAFAGGFVGYFGYELK